jgi:bloom syndrome protein
VAFIEGKHRGETGVIYCNARRTCESVAETLREKGFKAAYYHAGMLPDEKEQTVYNWQNGIVPLMVATVSPSFTPSKEFKTNIYYSEIAFGMGIDKADG